MNKMKFLSFLFRFSFLHLATYPLIAVLFISVQEILPESNRIALDLYEPFRSLSLIVVLGQILRGLIFALIFYSFYDQIFKSRWGWLIMFSALWGVALLGSVEPQPGSIEGIIYTMISFLEHSLVILAVAIQMLILVFFFFKWEAFVNKPELSERKILNFEQRKIKGYSLRFSVVHLLTDILVGAIFMSFLVMKKHWNLWKFLNCGDHRMNYFL